jgi:DDE superfamily endonuclease
MTRHAPIQVWIIDDTAFPKQGEYSVGVHHQYCGQLGKQANCQVAVTLSIANHHASLPIAYRLYLPKERIEDRLAAKDARPCKDHVQDQVADCAGADPRCSAGERRSRRGADGCKLR